MRLLLHKLFVLGMCIAFARQGQSIEPINNKLGVAQQQSSTVSSSAKESIATELEAALTQVAIEQTQDVQLDLGTQICSREIQAVLTIRNPLKVPFTSHRITSSCGCISGLPREIAIREGESQLFRFKVRLPGAPEKMQRQIIFWDDLGNARLHLIVVCDVIIPIALDTTHFEIGKESRQTLKLTVSGVIPKVSLEQHTVSAQGNEVVKSEFLIKNSTKGVLNVEIDPSLLSVKQSSSSFTVTVTVSKNSSETVSIPVALNYITRSFTIPSTIAFKKQENEFLAQVLVRSSVLREQLAKGISITVEPVFSKGNEKRDSIPNVVVSAVPEARSNDAQLTSIRLILKQVDTEKQIEGLVLRCGTWMQLLECKGLEESDLIR